MEKVKKVPKLRFPEFTDDSEQRKLDEFVSFYNGIITNFFNYNKHIFKTFSSLTVSLLRHKNVLRELIKELALTPIFQNYLYKFH